jgi:hypothetical protein
VVGEGQNNDLVLAIAIAVWLGELALLCEAEPSPDDRPVTVLVAW